MDGKVPSGQVVVFDDDHYYMGSVIAQRIAAGGAKVAPVTPAAFVADWSRNTLEQSATWASDFNYTVNVSWT